MKRTLERAPIQIERDNLKTEVANLQNALASKDNEINSLKGVVSSASSSNSQKDSEINSLKSTISNNAVILSQKDNEISQLKTFISNIKVQPLNNPEQVDEINKLKTEIIPLKEKLAEYKHLADEKTGVVELLKTSLEELRLDKVDLRKDKLALLKENEQLKKQLLDFNVLEESVSAHNNNTPDNMMGCINHTVESIFNNNEVSLSGSDAVSNFNILDDDL